MPKYAPPPGKVVKGWTVRLNQRAEQAAQFRRDCGARRFACNWAVAEIKASFDAGRQTGEYDAGSGRHGRCASGGIRSRSRRPGSSTGRPARSPAHGGVSAPRRRTPMGWPPQPRRWPAGRRQGPGSGAGPKMQFPRFRKDERPAAVHVHDRRAAGRRSAHGGTARSWRRPHRGEYPPVWRHIRRGSARLLSATIREKAGRWYVSLRLEITAPRKPEPRTGTVGVDVGIGSNLLIVMHPDGTVAGEVPNPRALRSSLADLRRANRSLARKREGSPRWREAKRRLGRAHARVAAIPAGTIHQATTHLAKTHGQVVIEDWQSAR